MKRKTKDSKMRKLLLIIVLFVFLFSIFKIGNSFASTNILSVNDITVTSKSDTVEVKNVSVNNNKITNDIIFHKVGDSITYKITVKNNENEDYTIRLISDDNKSEYVTYEYDDYEGTVLTSNMEKSFYITAKYVKEITDISQRDQLYTLNISFTIEDKNGNIVKDVVTINPNKINPKTGDSIIIYVNTLILSLILLVLIMRNKKININKGNNKNVKRTRRRMKFLSLLIIAAIIMPNISTASENAALKINFNNSYELYDKLVVKFEHNDIIDEKIVNYGDKVSKPEDIKDGEENIEKWCLEDGTEFDFDTSIKNDLKLIARYSDSGIEETSTQYIVCFKENGGTGIMGKQTITRDTETNLNSNEFEREGYTFVGWNTKADNTGDNYQDKELVKNITTENQIDLYAQWSEKQAVFDTGIAVNQKMKKLAGNDAATYASNDSNIKSILKSETEPTEENKTENNIVSSTESEYPIYMWFDDGIIYWWTEDLTPSLNSNASRMFQNLFEVVDLNSLENFDITGTTTLNMMFSKCFKVKSYDFLKDWDTSNVTNMAGTFQHMNAVISIDLGNWNTSKVTDMSYMFGNGITNNISELKEIKGIENWDVSNVTSMEFMFGHQVGLETLDLSGWDTSSVTNMKIMFNSTNLKTIYVSDKFVTDQVSESADMFERVSAFAGLSKTPQLVGGNGTTWNQNFTDKTYARIDTVDTPGYFTSIN